MRAFGYAGRVQLAYLQRLVDGVKKIQTWGLRHGIRPAFVRMAVLLAIAGRVRCFVPIRSHALFAVLNW